jgi:hypothetical protein
LAWLFWAAPATAQPLAVPSSYDGTVQPVYVAPFQLRGIVPRDALRIDSTLAAYAHDDNRGTVAVTMVGVQTRLDEGIALQFRWGLIDHQVSRGGESRTGVLNPTVGFLVATRLSTALRLAFSLTAGVPVGTGGGDEGDRDDLRMQRQGALARSSMDNTNFGVNDAGFPVGLSLAYVARGLTCQLDVTVTPSARVRGEHVQADASKVNATSGLFVGQVVLTALAVGFELRYQRFLSVPAAVAADPESRDNLTAALGARAFADLGRDVSLRPALSYGRSVRGAGLLQRVQAIQLDLPLLF